jgi:hypothetical protein
MRLRTTHASILFLMLGFALAAPGSALADSALLTPDGTLLEVFPARYGDVVAVAATSPDARVPVLALRKSPSGGAPTLEVVPGTFDQNDEDFASLEFEENTGTIFVAYTKYQGLMADVHVAVEREGRWFEQNVLPTLGIYLSVNPVMVVTRQTWIDFDGRGGTVEKTRSILSMVFWEESGSASQARFACLFVEDGVLKTDDVVVVDLNELSGEDGATQAQGLPLSSYQFPAVQRDPTTNGGVLVSFANLSSRLQHVIRVEFPSDIRTFVPAGSTRAPREAYARAHYPVGRTGRTFPLPSIDSASSVGQVISATSVPTFYWQDRSSLSFVRAGSGASKPKSILLRPDFSLDRAVLVVKGMAEKD